MNACYVTHAFVRYDGDPIGSFIFRLAGGMTERGVHVAVVAPHAGGLPGRESIDGISIVRFRYGPGNLERLAYQGNMHGLVRRSIINKTMLMSFLGGFLAQTVRTIRAEKSDIVHAHWWFPSGLVGAMASAITGVPLVITCHGTDVGLLDRNNAVDCVARRVFARAAGVTTVSSYLEHRLAHFLREPDADIPVTPMPVDQTFFARVHNCLSGRKRSFTVLGVGRLSLQKCFQDLITATAIVRGRGVDANVILIGDGEEEASLKELAGRLGIQKQVQFLGSKTPTELAEYYRMCDAVVLPSHDEGLGLTLIEAMLCGAPAVGARSGGITDIVVDNETGLLFPPGDAPALAGALQRVLTDTRLANRLSRDGQAFARRNFDPAACVDKMLNVYESVHGRAI